MAVVRCFLTLMDCDGAHGPGTAPSVMIATT